MTAPDMPQGSPDMTGGSPDAIARGLGALMLDAVGEVKGAPPQAAPGGRSAAELAALAGRLRLDILEMIGKANSGHPGGSLSAIDLVTALYFHEMRHDPKRPDWEQRDRFILSKGHGAPALYAALGEAGYFDKALFGTLRQLGSPLQGHPEQGKLAGVEASTGSLGQGLSLGIGMALAAKVRGIDHRTYVLTGDGELDEGQIWEAALYAGAHALDSLVAIVDVNRMQLDDSTAKILPSESLAEKWRAFRWHVVELDGHDMAAILAALAEARATKGQPTVLLAHTIKGKGVSFMENENEWHGTAPAGAQLALALKELGKV